MPDIITSQEQDAIAAFIAKNGITKQKPGSSVPYGTEVPLKGRKHFNSEQAKAFAQRDQKVRELAALGMTRAEIASAMGVDRRVIDYTAQKLCLDVAGDRRRG